MMSFSCRCIDDTLLKPFTPFQENSLFGVIEAKMEDFIWLMKSKLLSHHCLCLSSVLFISQIKICPRFHSQFYEKMNFLIIWIYLSCQINLLSQSTLNNTNMRLIMKLQPYKKHPYKHHPSGNIDIIHQN